MTPLKSFPVSIDNTLPSCADAIRKIGQVRADDQKQWLNLQNLFVSGRRVTRVPSAGNNVLATDNVGDFNVTATFAYFLINNSGTIEWVRVAVATW